jgi:large subunit ribosomal protein L10
MSKPVKEMMVRDYAARLDGVRDALVVSVRGVKGTDTTRMRGQFASRGIRITVVRNALARRAIQGSTLEPLARVLEGPSALAYGSASVVEVAREIVSRLDAFPGIELKGAVLDGELFEGADGVKALSRYPTRVEAIGRVAARAAGPGRSLAAAFIGPGARVAGALADIRDRLQKGESISRVA